MESSPPPSEAAKSRSLYRRGAWLQVKGLWPRVSTVSQHLDGDLGSQAPQHSVSMKTKEENTAAGIRRLTRKRESRVRERALQKPARRAAPWASLHPGTCIFNQPPQEVCQKRSFSCTLLPWAVPLQGRKLPSDKTQAPETPRR